MKFTLYCILNPGKAWAYFNHKRIWCGVCETISSCWIGYEPPICCDCAKELT